MTETTKKTSQARTTARKQTQKAQSTAKESAGTAARTARDSAQDTADSARDVGSAATQKAMSAARAVQRTATGAAERAAGVAGVVWTLVKARKAVVAGAGAGVVTAVASSYALGRRAGLQQRGPLSRLTGGRL